MGALGGVPVLETFMVRWQKLYHTYKYSIFRMWNVITYHIECPLYSQDKGGRVGNGKGTRAQILLKGMQEDVLSTLTGDISVFMWRGGE